MENLRHVPSEEGNLRIDRLISSKCLMYIRLMSTHPPSNSPHPQVSELTTCTLTGLVSLYSAHGNCLPQTLHALSCSLL